MYCYFSLLTIEYLINSMVYQTSPISSFLLTKKLVYLMLTFLLIVPGIFSDFYQANRPIADLSVGHFVFTGFAASVVACLTQSKCSRLPAQCFFVILMDQQSCFFNLLEHEHFPFHYSGHISGLLTF